MTAEVCPRNAYESSRHVGNTRVLEVPDGYLQDEVQEGMADGGFNSKSMGMTVQKKLLSKLGTKSTIKVLIDDNMSSLLDHVYHLCKDYTQNKKDAEKLMKHFIKIVIKIGLLYRNNQFNAEELKIAETFRRKFRSMIMTFVSFHEVEFSFDQKYLSESVNECCALLQKLVVNHLTEKSLNRIKYVFKFFADEELLETLFEKDSPLTKHLDGIVTGLNRLIENGDI